MTTQNNTSAVSLFKFNAADIRVVTLEGNPWFVAKDVCEYLGLKPDASGSYFKRLAQLDPKERRTLTRADTLSTGVCPIFPAGGGAVRVASISESGLYGLVSASRKPEAQEFKRWVRQTVLPSIRKDGGYVLGEEKVVTSRPAPVQPQASFATSLPSVRTLKGATA